MPQYPDVEAFAAFALAAETRAMTTHDAPRGRTRSIPERRPVAHQPATAPMGGPRALVVSTAMAMNLGEPENGCLLLADISGYTEYMGGTELAHAQDVVADLLETIVNAVEPTFTLAKLEGDAAFSYASIDTVNPSMMMDTVESAYFAFQKRLRDVVHATTCECDACIRIPSLDLKFFVHDGEYIVRHIARSEELTGSDVILVHRLAKGTAGDRIGKPAYAVYTRATLEAMAMDPSILGFVPHTETFDDLSLIHI